MSGAAQPSLSAVAGPSRSPEPPLRVDYLLGSASYARACAGAASVGATLILTRARTLTLTLTLTRARTRTVPLSLALLLGVGRPASRLGD